MPIPQHNPQHNGSVSAALLIALREFLAVRGSQSLSFDALSDLRIPTTEGLLIVPMVILRSAAQDGN